MSLTDLLVDGAGWYVVFLVSLTFHEAAHAWAAMRLGDPTAYHGGQVSLNPAPHVQREPFGTVVFPILSFAIGGWMMGWASAPYDPQWARQYPYRAAWMALAGPAANLLLVLIAGLIITAGVKLDWFALPDVARFDSITLAVDTGGVMDRVARLVSILFMLNLLLMVFNLLPFPPLDGSAALGLLMNRRTVAAYQDFMQQPWLPFVGILIAWRLIDAMFNPVMRFALSVLYPGSAWGA